MHHSKYFANILMKMDLNFPSSIPKLFKLLGSATPFLKIYKIRCSLKKKKGLHLESGYDLQFLSPKSGVL